MNAEIRAIRESEIGACLDLWKRVWPQARIGYFERYFCGDHDFQADYTRVAVLDGGIVAAAHIVKRRIGCGDCELTLGGLSNVACDPEYRGNGHALACVRQAVQVMESDATDLSILFSSQSDYYARAGYEPTQIDRLVGDLRPDPLHPFTRMVVRPYDDRDDAAIHLIHVAFNRRRPLTVRRSAPYWRDWLQWWQGHAPDRAMVAEHEGAVVGYCLYRLDEESGRLVVREIGVRDGAELALYALLEEAAEYARMRHVPTMTVPLHEELVVQEVSSRLFVKMDVEPASRMAVRFLHRDNLLRGLAPLLTDRWHCCGSPAGVLRFAGPYGTVTIAGDGPFLRILAEDTEEEALSQSELFQLLIGHELPRERLSPDERKFAYALFPPHDPWFWEQDGF